MSDDCRKSIYDTPYTLMGKKWFVECQDVADLNIPVINIGPYGMDGHKRLERMEMTYSLEMVPDLTNIVLNRVLERE